MLQAAAVTVADALFEPDKTLSPSVHLALGLLLGTADSAADSVTPLFATLDLLQVLDDFLSPLLCTTQASSRWGGR